MPGKSRHGKGKRLSRRKRSREKQHISSVAAQQQVDAETVKPVSQPKVSAPLAKLTATQYPYIAAELLAIGILAGIMLVVLVVLALVL